MNLRARVMRFVKNAKRNSANPVFILWATNWIHNRVTMADHAVALTQLTQEEGRALQLAADLKETQNAARQKNAHQFHGWASQLMRRYHQYQAQG